MNNPITRVFRLHTDLAAGGTARAALLDRETNEECGIVAVRDMTGVLSAKAGRRGLCVISEDALGEPWEVTQLEVDPLPIDRA